MNQLLKTIDITQSRIIRAIISKVKRIFIIGINSVFFTARENKRDLQRIKKFKMF
jgi:DNA-binding MurR/RpiR family transcriptional regulator